MAVTTKEHLRQSLNAVKAQLGELAQATADAIDEISQGGTASDAVLQTRKTLAEWQEEDPVIAEGRLAYITDTDKFVFGDGESKFSELPQIGVTLADFADLINEGTITLNLSNNDFMTEKDVDEMFLDASLKTYLSQENIFLSEEDVDEIMTEAGAATYTQNSAFMTTDEVDAIFQSAVSGS